MLRFDYVSFGIVLGGCFCMAFAQSVQRGMTVDLPDGIPWFRFIRTVARNYRAEARELEERIAENVARLLE